LIGRKDWTTPLAEYIDTSADVQMEPAKLAVDAGVANLRVYFREGSLAVPVELIISTTTGLHRGVHMSRLVRAANARVGKSIEAWVKEVCAEVNKSQPNTEVTASYELPYDDQFVKTTVRTTQGGAITYRFIVQGITACPCSKKMTGVGHMQRAEITLIIRSVKAINSRGVVGKILECFSAAPKEEMKRPDEARKILEAQANPRFAEDLVRECVKRFPNALFASSRCFESIHAHDAIATWSARPGWIPSL
jgi:GTP cyclohydrolase FolE2